MRKDRHPMTASPIIVGRVVTATIALTCVLIIYDGWTELRLRDVIYVIVAPVLAIFITHVFSASVALEMELGRRPTRREWITTVRFESGFLLRRLSSGSDPDHSESRRCLARRLNPGDHLAGSAIARLLGGLGRASGGITWTIARNGRGRRAGCKRHRPRTTGNSRARETGAERLQPTSQRSSPYCRRGSRRGRASPPRGRRARGDGPRPSPR